MKIVCFTEIEKDKEYGLFLATCNRLLAMQETGIEIDLYSLRKYHSGLWAMLRRLLRLEVKRKEVGGGFTYKGLQCSYIPYKETLLGYILEKSGYPKYTLKGAEKVIKQIDCEYIIAHWGLEPAYLSMMLASKKEKPFVVYYHGSDVNTTPQCWKKPLKKVLQKAGCNIFVSEALLEKAQSHYSKINNAIISHNGWTNNKDANMPSVRKKNVILYAGALERIKGADLLPDIIKAISKKNSNAEFIIAGTGSLYDQIKADLSDTNINFQMIGRIEHRSLISLMKEISVLIAPSRSEGMSLVLLEGVATNTPVVITKLDSTSCILDEQNLVTDMMTTSRCEYIEEFSKKVILLMENTEARYTFRVKSWDEIANFELERLSQL